MTPGGEHLDVMEQMNRRDRIVRNAFWGFIGGMLLGFLLAALFIIIRLAASTSTGGTP